MSFYFLIVILKLQVAPINLDTIFTFLPPELNVANNQLLLELEAAERAIRLEFFNFFQLFFDVVILP